MIYIYQDMVYYSPAKKEDKTRKKTNPRISMYFGTYKSFYLATEYTEENQFFFNKKSLEILHILNIYPEKCLW